MVRSPSAFLLLFAASCARTPPTGETGAALDADADADADADSDADTDAPGDQVRIVTWNVEGLGRTGSAEYVAARDVLARIDADVVALNEVDWHEDVDLENLADALGYPTVVSPSDNPFGSLHNAILTRLPVVGTEIWTSAALSADAQANDLTRWPVAVEVEAGSGAVLAVVAQHWKSGFETADEFRRVVDGERTAQAALLASTAAVVAMGDVNADVGDGPSGVPTWSYVPADVPPDYRLGTDLVAELDGPGLPNDVFAPMRDAGLEVVDARQMDGRYTTRNESGRRLDYAFASGGVEVLGAEVYDAADESLGTGLPKAGAAPDREACLTASDHFPVFVDVIP